MKKSDLVKQYIIPYQGKPVQTDNVVLGDTVWWFIEGHTGNVPSIATITRLGDDMVTLRIAHDTGSGSRTITGVVPIGDERLKNPNVRKNGAWCPRVLWDILQLTGE